MVEVRNGHGFTEYAFSPEEEGKPALLVDSQGKVKRVVRVEGSFTIEGDSRLVIDTKEISGYILRGDLADSQLNEYNRFPIKSEGNWIYSFSPLDQGKPALVVNHDQTVAFVVDIDYRSTYRVKGNQRIVLDPFEIKGFMERGTLSSEQKEQVLEIAHKRIEHVKGMKHRSLQIPEWIHTLIHRSASSEHFTKVKKGLSTEPTLSAEPVLRNNVGQVVKYLRERGLSAYERQEYLDGIDAQIFELEGNAKPSPKNLFQRVFRALGRALGLDVQRLDMKALLSLRKAVEQAPDRKKVLDARIEKGLQAARAIASEINRRLPASSRGIEKVVGVEQRYPEDKDYLKFFRLQGGSAVEKKVGDRPKLLYEQLFLVGEAQRELTRLEEETIAQEEILAQRENRKVL
jgi:hypothetical protein